MTVSEANAFYNGVHHGFYAWTTFENLGVMYFGDYRLIAFHENGFNAARRGEVLPIG